VIPPGRFLKKNSNAVWREIEEKTAIAKTSQALREDAPRMRQQSLSSNVIQNSEISGTLAHQPVHLETTCGLSSDHDSSSSVEKIHGKEEIITKLSENDVLLGRGMRTNRHKGNVRYRMLIKKYQPEYLQLKLNKGKKLIAKHIVHQILAGHPIGRFLKKKDNGKWIEVDRERAVTKTSQALREGAPLLRRGQFNTLMASTSTEGRACENTPLDSNMSVMKDENNSVVR